MITCPKCGKECKDQAKFCGGCGYKFQEAVQQNADILANTCPKCGNSLRPGAKFCGKCGERLSGSSPVPLSQSADNVQNSGKNSEAATKEIIVVGSFIQWNILPGQLAVKINEKDIESYGKVVKGINIQEGVKALVFVHGKLIAELGSGNYPFKDWEADIPQTDKPGIVRRFVGAICNILPQSVRERAQSMGLTAPNTPPFSFVLIRTNEFPLIYSFPDTPTSTVSCEVGIHMLLKITNINDFYTNLLLDKKFIGFETIKNQLITVIRSQINFAFRAITPEQVSNTPEIQGRLLPQLQAVVSEVYPYIQLSRILQISAQNADLENFRRMAEELYISERELVELTKRNEFLTRLQAVKNEQEFTEFNQTSQHNNRMQDARNEQELNELNRDNNFHNRKEDANMEQSLRDQSRQIQYENRSQTAAQAHELETLERNNTQELQIARSNANLETAKEKVYEQMQLAADERAKFDLMLSAQAKLREARTEEEIAVAVQEFKKSGLLRDQEIETLQHQISQKAKLRDLDDAQALSMATMQNQIALDQQKLEWEIQIGNKRIQNQFDRQRIQDAYNDERRDSDVNFSDKRREADAAFTDKRRNADAEFEDSRRRSGIDLDRQEQENQFDMLKKAQALRMEREDAEHKREMESEEAARKHELDTQRLAQESEKNKLDAANEEKRIYAGMTADQIMAANPNISEHAARALEAKFKNDNALQAANDKAQMAADMQSQMNAFMQQQMQSKDKETQNIRDMMMQMMQMNNQQNMQQMQMMRDQATAFAGAGASAQQQLMDAKQQELDRTRADANANSDRFVDGMKTTIEAVGNMGRPVVVAPAAGGGRHGGGNAPVVAKTQETVRTCPQCHKQLADDETFCCESCGATL